MTREEATRKNENGCGYYEIFETSEQANNEIEMMLAEDYDIVDSNEIARVDHPQFLNEDEEDLPYVIQRRISSLRYAIANNYFPSIFNWNYGELDDTIDD